jgi:hypothetical protein
MSSCFALVNYGTGSARKLLICLAEVGPRELAQLFQSERDLFDS